MEGVEEKLIFGSRVGWVDLLAVVFMKERTIIQSRDATRRTSSSSSPPWANPLAHHPSLSRLSTFLPVVMRYSDIREYRNKICQEIEHSRRA